MVGVFYGLVLIELILLLLTPSRQQRVSIVFLVLLAIIFAYVPITVSDNWVYNWYYTHPEVPTKSNRFLIRSCRWQLRWDCPINSLN